MKARGSTAQTKRVVEARERDGHTMEVRCPLSVIACGNTSQATCAMETRGGGVCMKVAEGGSACVASVNPLLEALGQIGEARVVLTVSSAQGAAEALPY